MFGRPCAALILIYFSLLSPLCPLYLFMSLHSAHIFSHCSAPHLFFSVITFPTALVSFLFPLLCSNHSPRNKHCIEDLYWIIVFAIRLWVDSVIGFIHQGLCERDPANPAFAFPQRILDDLSIKRLQIFSRDG